MADQHLQADPRGLAAQSGHGLAPRLATIEGARILLVDNGKLTASYGPYGAIAETLADLFPGATFTTVSLDLLRYDHTRIARIADELLAAHAPSATIHALGDAGVSMQTTLLAAMFEKSGVPSLVLATLLGERVCRPIAQSQAPGLPILAFDTERTDSRAMVRGFITAAGPAIEAALARPVASGVATTTAAFGADHPAAWAEAAGHIADFQDWLEANALGDGLPLLPPTPRALAALLATVPDDPDAVLYGPALTSGRVLRVRDAAANAAMTACPPRAFPVVVAALRAVAQPDFRLSQAAITTHPSGYAVVLAGCDPARFGLSGGPGCLGPGHRGNASVGRAVSLSVQHLFGARPGGADLTILGSPAEFTYCFAEDLQGVAWTSLAGDFGTGAAGVFVMKAEGPRNVLEHLAVTPAAVCEALAAAAMSISSNNAYIPGDLLVIVNPEHARIFAHAGWTRDDLAVAIHNRARLPRAALEGRGVGPIRPKFMDGLADLPATRSPADVHVVVAGAAGPQSMVALPWGYSRGQWQAISAT